MLVCFISRRVARGKDFTIHLTTALNGLVNGMNLHLLVMTDGPFGAELTIDFSKGKIRFGSSDEQLPIEDARE